MQLALGFLFSLNLVDHTALAFDLNLSRADMTFGDNLSTAYAANRFIAYVLIMRHPENKNTLIFSALKKMAGYFLKC